MKDNVEIAKDYTDWMVKTGGYAKDMTMRDHFAGLAMQALASHYSHDFADMAVRVYRMADAMLKERSK